MSEGASSSALRHSCAAINDTFAAAWQRTAPRPEQALSQDLLPFTRISWVSKAPAVGQEGGFAAGGWLVVDPKTLRHRRFPNVFGIGDINGTAKGKTAATVKKSAPIVAQHLIEVIAGREPSQVFDGYTSCPLLLREGSALLVEFDYENNLTPSLPRIDPLQDSYFAWVMKYRLLKPAYMAVAKGRV